MADTNAASAKKSKKKAEQAAPSQPVVVAYKGFGPDWKCRDFQYALGETYEHAGKVAACEQGFHACEYPFDVFAYYAPAGSRFAIVEQSGEIARHDSDTKVASSRIHLKAEIDLAGLVKAGIEWTFSKALPVDPESPASATGDRGAASATGYSGAASATGDSGAASATGESSVAMASGRFGRAQAAEGCALFLVERDDAWKIVAVWAGIGGQGGIKPLTWYTLEGGKPVEVAS